MRLLGGMSAALVLVAAVGVGAWKWPTRGGDPTEAASSGEPADEAPAAEEPSGAVPSPADEVDCDPAPLADRAATLLIVGLPGVTEPDAPLVAELADVGVGGVFLTAQNVDDAYQVRSLIQGLRDRLGDDLLVAADEETGRVSSFRAVIGDTSAPRHASADADPRRWRQRAEEIGDDLSMAGVDWNLAPVADVDGGAADGAIGDRAFGGDAGHVSEIVEEFVAGHDEAGIISTVKHFPGHGSAVGDPHSETVRDARPLSALEEDLRPFRAGIEAGAPAVMLSHVVHAAFAGDRPASLSPEVYELLRDLGFAGVAVTDSLGMGAVHLDWGYDGAAVQALAAGADALLATDGNAAETIHEAVMDAVDDGVVEERRLDQAATRVLTLAGVDPEPVTCRTVPADFPEHPDPVAEARLP